MQFEVWLSTEQFVTYEVSMFTVEQVLGLPASATVDCFTDEDFTLEQLVGGNAKLVYSSSHGIEQTVVGVIDWVELASRGNNQGAHEPTVGYRLHLVSRISLLSGSVSSRIFQEKNVKEIVTQVLGEHGIV